MNRTHLVTTARLLAALAATAALLLLLLGGAAKPGYSHVANFISELNATGTPRAQEIGLFGFLPLGVLVALFLLAAAPVVRVEGWSRLGFLLLFSQPIAYIGVFFFPCDLGCPLKGSPTQAMHNFVAVLTYIACAAGFLLLSQARALAAHTAVRAWFVGTAVLWFVGFFAMVEPAIAPWRGVLQRVLEASLYASLLLIAWRMLGAQNTDH